MARLVAMVRRAFVLSFVLLTVLLTAVPTVSARPEVCHDQPALPLYDFATECASWAGEVADGLGETVGCLEREVMVIIMCDVIGGPFCQLVPGPCQ